MDNKVHFKILFIIKRLKQKVIQREKIIQQIKRYKIASKYFENVMDRMRQNVTSTSVFIFHRKMNESVRFHKTVLQLKVWDRKML